LIVRGFLFLSINKEGIPDSSAKDLPPLWGSSILVEWSDHLPGGQGPSPLLPLRGISLRLLLNLEKQCHLVEIAVVEIGR